MEANEQVARFTDFLDEHYKDKIQMNQSEGFIFDFFDVARYDAGLAEELLEEPQDCIKAAELGYEDLHPESKKANIRVKNLPDTCMIPIWEIRTQLKKFIKVEGYISEQGEILIRPMVNRYECPSCGTVIPRIRHDDFSNIAPPSACGCGRKKNFRLVAQESSNVKKIIIEEDIMEIGERQIPKRKVVLIKDDLTDTKADREMRIGRKVIINGWLQTYESNPKTGDMDTYLVANYIEFLERGWPTITTNKGEQKTFHEMAKKKDILTSLKQSIMPTIHGENEIKEALFLQLVGSENVLDKSGYLEDRGCIHLALVGNPGSGKTAMIKRMMKFWPIYRFASAQTATGRGLIATAVQEKQLDNKWVLMPGVLPTCTGGLCAIDELDKMNKDDYGFLNNAMNDLKVYVDKAAHGILDTDTAILTSMNPEGRVFIEGTPIYSQISLPADLLDRFDLIFPVFAKTEEDDQRKVFRIGLAKRQQAKTIDPEYSEETIIKYVAYARTFHPRISDEMGKVIEDRVIAFMRPGSAEYQQVSNRIFGIIFRLICGYARIFLREDVTVEDLNLAMGLLIYSYQKQGLLTKEGLLDFAKTERVDTGAANILQAIKGKIRELESKDKNSQVDIGELIASLVGEDYTEDKLEQTIEKMKRYGDIYEPRNGFLARVK